MGPLRVRATLRLEERDLRKPAPDSPTPIVWLDCRTTLSGRCQQSVIHL